MGLTEILIFLIKCVKYPFTIADRFSYAFGAFDRALFRRQKRTTGSQSPQTGGIPPELAISLDYE